MTIEMTSQGLTEINTSKAVYTEAGMVNSGYSDCTVRITYAATMNSDASVVYGDDGNPNEVVLLWKLYKGQLKSSDSLYMGMAPELPRSGLDTTPLVFTVHDFKKSTTQKHNVPRRAIKAIRQNLENALFSFGEGNRIGFIVPDIDGDGKPLLIGIEKGVVMDRKTVNAVRSVYGLDNPEAWIRNQIASGKNLQSIKKRGKFLSPNLWLLGLGGRRN